MFLKMQKIFIRIIKIKYHIKPFSKYYGVDIIIIFPFIKRKKKNGLILNLYRLSPSLKGGGVGVLLIRTSKWFPVATAAVKDSQYLWKHKNYMAHIKNLFYTFIWNFCPELIRDGYVYAGVPPLYKITIGKKYKYLKNDEELERFRAEHQGEKYLVNRMKGLGEMSAEETEETLTDPEQRIIKQITVEDIVETNQLFDDLMGTAIIPRKKFIQEHSAEATYGI